MDFEGRESKRIGSENFLSYKLYDADGRICNQGMVITIDISRSGIAIKSPVVMEAGQKIELALGVGNELVNASGVVRNNKQINDNEWHVGIEFDFLSDEDLDKLASIYPEISD